MIQPGELRERVVVQLSTGTTSAMGETIFAWSDSTTFSASVQGVSSRELLLAGQQQTQITHRIKMRYIPTLTQQMRFSWRGKTLEIVSLLEHENRSEHEAICQETT